MTKSAEEIREDKASELSIKAAEWIVDQLKGCRGLGWRGVSDLENEIYGWLIDHAIFNLEQTPPKGNPRCHAFSKSNT